MWTPPLLVGRVADLTAGGLFAASIGGTIGAAMAGPAGAYAAGESFVGDLVENRALQACLLQNRNIWLLEALLDRQQRSQIPHEYAKPVRQTSRPENLEMVRLNRSGDRASGAAFPPAPSEMDLPVGGIRRVGWVRGHPQLACQSDWRKRSPWAGHLHAQRQQSHHRTGKRQAGRQLEGFFDLLSRNHKIHPAGGIEFGPESCLGRNPFAAGWPP